MNWHSILLYAFVNYLTEKHLTLKDVNQSVIFNFTKELNDYVDLACAYDMSNNIPNDPFKVQTILRNFIKGNNKK